MDITGVLKTQVMTALKDVKVQLEKCKSAHLDYISKKEDVTMDDNTWIEEVFKLYESYNTEIELKRKQNIRVKMERVKMPFFDSNIRNYAKFKKDFERQIQKQVDSEETLIYVLKSCLSEKALNVVKNIDDDIKEIWKRLDDKFGNTSVLIDIVMNDIKEIKSVKDGDMKEFIHFV